MNTDKKLAVGIIGCGIIADIQAQAINQSSHCKLVAAFSRSQERVSQFSEKFNVPGFTDWDRFISAERMDAVSICTASGTHLDYGKLAAISGKHIITEKPLEVRVSRGKELIDHCKQKSVALAVIYQSRFIPELITAQKKLQEKHIGDIFLADVRVKWFRSQEYYDSAAWRGTLALDGGGVLINQAIHTVDVMQWFLGPVKRVTAHTITRTHSGIEGEDNAVVLLSFASGAIGTLIASTSVIPAQSRKMELHGTKGSMVLDGDHIEWLVGADAQLAVTQSTAKGASSPLQNFPIEPHRDQFDAIARAIFSGEPPPVSGEESLQSLAIVEAVYTSSRLQQPVELPAL